MTQLTVSIEDVSTEAVVVHEELLDDERSVQRGSWSLCWQNVVIRHTLYYIKSLTYSFRPSPYVVILARFSQRAFQGTKVQHFFVICKFSLRFS